MRWRIWGSSCIRQLCGSFFIYHLPHAHLPKSGLTAALHFLWLSFSTNWWQRLPCAVLLCSVLLCSALLCPALLYSFLPRPTLPCLPDWLTDWQAHWIIENCCCCCCCVIVVLSVSCGSCLPRCELRFKFAFHCLPHSFCYSGHVSATQKTIQILALKI